MYAFTPSTVFARVSRKKLGLLRMTGEARLVKLDEIDPRRSEFLQLAVDDRHECAGYCLATVVDVAAIDAARECERAQGPAPWSARS